MRVRLAVENRIQGSYQVPQLVEHLRGHADDFGISGVGLLDQEQFLQFPICVDADRFRLQLRESGSIRTKAGTFRLQR